MAEVGFPSNAKTFSLIGHDSPVIVVTSLRPKGRPVSARQQRLAEFCNSDGGRREPSCREPSRREPSRREKLSNRRSVRPVSVATCPAPCKTWNTPGLVLSLKDLKEEAHHDDVKVLYPARDLLYSDSDVAILSSCSSWCVGPPSKQEGLTYDAGPSRVASERYSLDEIPTKLSSRIGLVEKSSGIGDRFLNKPPGGLVPSEELASFSEETERKQIQKPYGQVWHNRWEHNRVESSNSAKRSKHVIRLASGKELAQEQISASTNSIFSSCIMDRKQRWGVFHPIGPMAQRRLTYRSRSVTRPWGRSFHQRAPSTGARFAQRKVSSMKDDDLEDSESLLNKRPKPRRCELSNQKSVPRVVVTGASRPGTVVAAGKADFSSPVLMKTAPANLKRGTMENANNRSWHFGKPPKPVTRPRFSVPIKASRVPMDLLFKEMNSHKPDWAKRDADIRQRALKYRGVPSRALNAVEQPYSDLNQNPGSCHDARLAVHFAIPDRARTPSLQGGRRLFPSPLYNRVDMNIYETDPEVKLIVNESPGSDPLPSQPPPGLKANLTGGLVDRGAHWRTTVSSVPILNHFLSNAVPSRQPAVKSPNMFNYKIEPDNTLHPGYQLSNSATGGMPPFFSNDVAVSPDYLYDGHISDQAPTAFRFSHPNAPDVLISPPPNPQLRGDSLCIPSPMLESENPPVTMFNPCVQPVDFPRYYGIRSPDTSIEKNVIPVQPFTQPNVPFRPFMPSVDFSRLEPPPRPQSRAFPPGTDTGQIQMSYDENTLFPENWPKVAAKPSSISPHNRKTSKPSKLLLTFGAQVPSSPRIPTESLTSKGLSSPRLENQDADSAYPQNSLMTSNSRLEDLASDLEEREHNTGLTNHKDTGGCVVPSILEPNAQQCRTGSNIETSIKKRSITGINSTNEMALRENTMAMSEKNITVNLSWNSTPKNEVAERGKNLAQTNSFSLFENISAESSKTDTEFVTKQVDLTESRTVFFRELNSDTKLSTVTEVSAEVLQPGGSPCVEEYSFELYHSSTVDLPEMVQNRNRFQLIEDSNGDTDVNVEESEHCTTKGNAPQVTTSSNQVVTLASSEILDYDAHTTEHDACDEGGGHLTGYIKRVSNSAPSRTNSMKSPDMASGQSMNQKTSLTDNVTGCLDGGFEDTNRVAKLLRSSSSSPTQRRFQSLVSRLDNISLHCKPSGSRGPSLENYSFSEAVNSRKSSQVIALIPQEQVERRDVFVQVPVLCTQSLETEPFTAEKGVPDYRAGLTLRLLSTVVDVPPIVRSTESVGTNTEEEPREKSLPARKVGIVYCPTALKLESESGPPISDQVCATSAQNANSSSSPVGFVISGESRRPELNVPIMDKQFKRLKPFFKSHRTELANVYNLTALHSLTLDTEIDRSTKQREEKLRRYSTASREDKLKSDSNSSTELRKDRHAYFYDDVRNYDCEYGQPKRLTKHHVADRRVSFRPSKRETDIISSPTDECSHTEDERVEQHHRLLDIHVGSLNEIIAPQKTLNPAKDLRHSEKVEQLCDIHENVEKDQKDCKTLTRPASDAADRVETIDTSSGREENSSHCRNYKELSEQSRPSSGDLNFDNVIALKRKPGYALSIKTRSSVSKRKGILKSSKDAKEKTKPSDVPSSILRLGLSSIVAPVDVDTQDDIVITTGTFNVACSEERPQPKPRSHSSPKKSQYVRSVASIIAPEASKRAESTRSSKASQPKNDCSVVITQDSAAFDQSSKSPGNGGLNDKGDTSASLDYTKHTSDTNISTVPGIYLTMSGSNNAPAATPTSPEASAPPVVDIRSEHRSKQAGEDNATQDSSLNTSSSKRAQNIEPEIRPQFSKPNGTKSKHTKKITITDCSDVFETGVSTDYEQTSRHFEKTDLSEVVRGLESPQSSRSCMFTAMRRLMKNRQRQDVCAKKYVPPVGSNEYPGFQFTGVPVTESECLSFNRLSNCSHRKCKHRSNHDWPCSGLPGEPLTTCEMDRRCGPKRCPMDPLMTKNFSTKICDARVLSETDEQNDEFQVSSSQGKRVPIGQNAQNKILWQNACHRTYATTQPIVDPYDSDEVKSESSELFRSRCLEARNISDDFSSYAVRVSRPPSAEYRRAESPKHVVTCALCSQKDCVDKSIHGLRTLPPDMASGEGYRLRYPRCTSVLPNRPCSPRKSSAPPRSASVPAGVVRISHGRCWPLPHSVYKVAHGPRRLTHKHVKLLECDSFTYDRCEHRKVRQRVPSCIYDDQLHRQNDDVFVLVDDRHGDLGDAYCRHAHKQCSCRPSRKDRKK